LKGADAMSSVRIAQRPTEFCSVADRDGADPVAVLDLIDDLARLVREGLVIVDPSDPDDLEGPRFAPTIRGRNLHFTNAVSDEASDR
jgi:hypothetical protein